MQGKKANPVFKQTLGKQLPAMVKAVPVSPETIKCTVSQKSPVTMLDDIVAPAPCDFFAVVNSLYRTVFQVADVFRNFLRE
jgi:hypothetical protein